MSAICAAVVPFGDGRYLLRTIESLERQTRPPEQIVVAAVGPVGPVLRRALDLVGSRPSVRVLGDERPTPGAARNAAIRSSNGSWLLALDEGDRVCPTFCERAVAALEQDPAAAFATSWVLRRPIALGAAGSPIVPAVNDLEAALCAPESRPAACLIRRDAWTKAGGYDEAVETLEDYDLWLSILEGGGAGVLLEDALVEQALHREAAWRRALDPARRLPALRRILGRHEAALRRHDVRVLLRQEEAHASALARHRERVGRRDALVAELDAAQHEIARLEKRLRDHGRPPIDWGDFGRPAPVSRDWGYDRGTPVDRRYIERFVETFAEDIRGTVLEVQEADLTRRFGGDRVVRCDVLDVNPANAGATIVADLRRAPQVPSGRFDCIVLTQTLHVIDDMRAALAECRRLLKPGGVLLATLPCASRVCLEYGADGDFWRATEAGARALAADVFGDEAVEVRAYGNVLVNAAFLYGLACEEIPDEHVDLGDPFFPLLVGVRAVRLDDGDTRVLPSVRRRVVAGRAAVLLYHRVADAAIDPHGLCVPSDEFASQMAHLREAYDPIPLERLLASSSPADLPPRAVAVTFDDGYVDNLTAASPILAGLGIPATFFVTTGMLERPREFWWDGLARWLLGPGARPAALAVTLGVSPVTLAVRSTAERRAAHDRLYTALVAAPLAARERLMSEVARWAGDGDGAGAARPMSGAELRELASRPGHTVGSHSVHHLALPSQPPDVQACELRQSREALEALLGRPIRGFAYPFGACTAETAASARTAGYALAVTCEARTAGPDDDPRLIPRVDVGAWKGRDFAATLASFVERR